MDPSNNIVIHVSPSHEETDGSAANATATTTGPSGSGGLDLNDMVDRISLAMNRSMNSLHGALSGNPAYAAFDDDNSNSNNNEEEEEEEEESNTHGSNEDKDEDEDLPRVAPPSYETIEMRSNPIITLPSLPTTSVTKTRNNTTVYSSGTGAGVEISSGDDASSTASADDPASGKKGRKGKKDKKDKKKGIDPAQQVPLSTLLFRFASPFDKILMLIGTLGALGAGGSLPVMTVIFGEMIDVFTDYTNTNDVDKFNDDIIKFTLWFVGLAIVAFVASYLEMAFWMMVGERLSRKIRLGYFRSILRQDVGWYDTQKAGDLTTRVQSDTHLIQEAIGEKIGTFQQHVTTFFAGFIIAFVKGWKLALVLIAVVPFLAVCGGFFSKMLASATTKGQKSYAQAGAVAEEVFSSIRTVTSFSGERQEMKRYNDNLMEAFKTGIHKASASGLGIGVTYLIMFMAYGLAFWFGSIMIDKGQMTSGGVLNVFFAILIGAFSLGHAGPPMSAFGVGKGAGFHVFGVIDRNPPIDSESPDGVKLGTVQGDISLRDVHFHYSTRPDVPILNGLSIDIEHGTTVALVGASGCGKSTVISLIERFYNPVSGDVFMDGRNIKEFNLLWLREQIGIVSQEPVLFNMTIAENIRMGKPEATDEEIYQAAKNANIHDFILSLPEAYRTPVGERGTQLSGGQKQRIAIARALVKNPKILLLDEATSALDNESEKIVQDALDRASKGRTTIVIAHRLSTIQNANKIIVLGSGKVVETGTHSELMKNTNGAYHSLVTAQTLNREESPSSGLDAGPKADVTRKSATKQSTASSSGATTGAASTSGAAKDPASGSSATGDKASADTEDGASEKKSNPELENYKVPVGRILALNRPELWAIILGMIGASANGVVMPIFAILFAEILGVFAKTGDDLLDGARFWAGMFVVLAVATGLANYAQTFFFGYSGEKLTYRLRQMSFKAILQQEIGFFDKPANATGALTARLAVDASLVQGMAGSRMGSLTQVMVNLIAGLIIAFVSGWKLTLVILACVPLIMIAGALQMKALSGFAQQGKLAYQHSGKIASEAIENIRTVTALNKQQYFLDEYSKHLEQPFRLGLRKSHAAGVGFGFSQAMMFFTYAVSFYYGSRLVKDNEMSFVDMMKTFSAVIFTAMAAGQMSQFAPDAAKAKQATYNIFELLDRKSAIDSMSEEGSRPAITSATVEFENVSFSYPERPDIKILDGISLRIPAGKTVALVGASGCGKSTVMALLQRFYDPLAGHIYVDGKNTLEMNVGHLRSQMGLVSQEPVLFGTTIEENIRYAKPDATESEVIQAAKDANIHNFISELPEGYKTQVGERGTQLSGGQKQRIAIARALIRNPKILLLDEATSALDTESEKIVQDALDRASKGRTTIVIAHRLSTIQNADMILVFSKGKVVETGTHQELLHRRGIYHQYATIQNH